MRKQVKKNVTLALSLAFALAIGGASASLFGGVNADALTSDLTFRSGASARTGDGSMGIRFTANLAENLLDNTTEGAYSFKDGTEVGMIIAPEWVLDGVTDTTDVFKYLKDSYGAEKAEVSTAFKDSYIQKDEKGYYARAAIVDLKTANLAETYQAIGYTYDGTTYQYSAKSDARTISYVLNAALADNDLTAEKRISVVKAIGEMSEQLKAADKMGGSELTIETDVATGVDLSAYVAENFAISSVTLGETEATVAGNKVTFEKEQAAADVQTLTVTYSDNTVINLNTKLWSLIVDNETELQQMNEYEWYTINNTYQVPHGYYKLNADIPMTANWSATYAIAANMTSKYPGSAYGFTGVFDGNGHTISNFNVPAGAHRQSLIGYMGKDSVVKNLTLNGTHSTTGSSGVQCGYLATYVQGGMIENVKITVSMADGYKGTPDGGVTYYYLANGAIGRVQTGDIAPITIKNVTVMAKDDTTSNRNYAPALLYVNNGITEATLKEKITLNNVAMVGFKTLVVGYVDLYQTADSLTNIANCINVKTFATENEYIDSLTISLNAVETEVAAGLDFNAVLAAQNVNKTIASVTLGGEAVTLTNGKVSYENTDASNVAKNYVVTATDGSQYKLSVTVWSLLIDNEEELRSMKNYAYKKNIYKWGDTEGTADQIAANPGYYAEAWYGYFKLNADIPMSATAWTITDGICNRNLAGVQNQCSYMTQYHGFRGVFEGNNKTITGLTLGGNYTSLIGVMGNGAIVRNVNFKDTILSKTAYANGVIANYVNGGMVENVTISVVGPEGKAGSKDDPTGIVFGSIGFVGSGYCDTITVKNVHVDLGAIEAFGENVAIIGACYKPSSGYKLPVCENVTVVGSLTSILQYGTQTTVENHTTYTGVTVFANQDKYQEYLDSLTEKTVVAKATTNYLIALPQSATAVETRTANSFRKYFQKATGLTLSIVTDSSVGEWDKSKQVISIGNTSLAESAGVKYTDGSKNGYKIKSVGSSVFLVGGEFGVENAAYALLEDWVAFDVYGKNAYTVDSVSELSYTQILMEGHPSIEYRLPYQAAIRYDADLRNAMRFNADTDVGVLAPSTTDGYVKATHNSWVYVPYTTYGASKPHWFAETVADSGRGQLCYSVYEEYMDIVVEKAVALLEANPTKNIVAFSHEDTEIWCTCSACAQSLQTYGTNSAVYVKFLNALAAELNAWAVAKGDDRTVKVQGLAYLATENAPVTYDSVKDEYLPADDSVVLKNVYIYFTVPYFDWQAEGTWTAEENAAFYANLRGWGTLAESLSIWTYNQYQTGYGGDGYFLFYQTFTGMQSVYQTLAEYNCYSLLDQGANATKNATAFNTLRAYLSSKLGWDVNADVDSLTDKFFDGYFGAAGTAMRKMYDRTVERCDDLYASGEVKNVEGNVNGWAMKIYGGGFIEEIEGYIAEAYAAIAALETTNPELYSAIFDRILLEELAIRYQYLNGIYLFQMEGRPFTFEFVVNGYQTSSVTLKFTEAEIAEMRASFKADCERLGITRCSESMDISTLWKNWGMTETAEENA